MKIRPILLSILLHSASSVLVFQRSSDGAGLVSMYQVSSVHINSKQEDRADGERNHAFAKVTLEDRNALLSNCHDNCTISPTLRILENAAQLRPVAHRMTSIGGLYECPCVSVQARQCFERLVVELVEGQWGRKRRQDREQGLSYVSFSSGGLFADLILLCGLVKKGIQLGQVMVCDSILKEMLHDYEGKSDIRLSWRGSQDPALSRCRQCEMSSQTRMKYHLRDLIANFCGWLGAICQWHSLPLPTIYMFGDEEDYVQACLHDANLKADVMMFCDVSLSNAVRDTTARLQQCLRQDGFQFLLPSRS